MESGSREENASKQEARASRRFHEGVTGSRVRFNCVELGSSLIFSIEHNLFSKTGFHPGSSPGQAFSGSCPSAFPLLMESEAGSYVFDLTRFLHANR
jgi:hypothetical protein